MNLPKNALSTRVTEQIKPGCKLQGPSGLEALSPCLLQRTSGPEVSSFSLLASKDSYHWKYVCLFQGNFKLEQIASSHRQVRELQTTPCAS